MGTSNSFGGPGGNTPLVPSWLGGDDQASPNDGSQDAPSEQQQDGDKVDKSIPPQKPVEITTPPPGRFQNARTNFTKFAKSGGRDRAALGRAVSSYVSTSLGGKTNASKRLGSSKQVAVGLVNFLNSVRTDGVQSALNSMNLSDLIGKSVEDIFIGLADAICPDGGSVDEGIARNAFIEAIVQLANQGITDLNNLTAEQVKTVLEMFATNTIEARLCNDIGTKICIAPENVAMVENTQQQLHDFIERSVADALDKFSPELEMLSTADTAKLIDEIYTEAFQILQTISESESEQ